MKQKFISMFILILLSACSSIAPAPTATELPASINAPLPTEPPTSAPTNTSSAPTENPTVSYGQQFTNDYMAKFDNIREGTKDVAGEKKKVIFGTDLETKVEQVIGMEMDGQMVRMGEWVDSEGRSFYAYIPNGFDIGQRIGVTSKTSEILFGTEDKPLSVNFFKSIGKQWGMTPEEAKAKILADGGIANFKVPIAPVPGSELAKDDYAVVWKDLPYPANFNLPIEIIAIEDVNKFDKLDQKFRDSRVTTREAEKELGISEGWLMTTKENGQIVIVSFSTGIEITPWVLNPKPDETKYVIEFIRGTVGCDILNSLDLIGNIKYGQDAYKQYAIFASWGKFDNTARNIFEYKVIQSNSSQ